MIGLHSPTEVRRHQLSGMRLLVGSRSYRHGYAARLVKPNQWNGTTNSRGKLPRSGGIGLALFCPPPGPPKLIPRL